MEIINRILSVLDWIIDWIEFFMGSVLPYWKQILVVIVLMWFFLKVIDLLLAWTSRRTIVATVNHKERVYYPKTLNSMYLIFTDKGVFRNQDSWAFFSFDSSDVYSKMIVGSTYQFTIYGYRYRWGSEYPNVLKVKLQ